MSFYIKKTEIQYEIDDCEEEHEELQSELKEIEEEQKGNDMEIDLLEEKKQDISDRLKQSKSLLKKLKIENSYLANQLKAAEYELEVLKHPEKEFERKESSMTEIIFTDKYKSEDHSDYDRKLKHNGSYMMNQNDVTNPAEKKWSCCLDVSENASGCIEENSVGLKSHLGELHNNLF